MVEHKPDPLDRIFRALADPSRRLMLKALAGGEQTVGELAEPFEISLAAASKHIQVLERAGLVTRTVIGREHRCRLNADPLEEAHGWFTFYEKFWSDRLDALERALKADDRTKRRKK
jgi:DNA-binding transcriptional ArsR family regulator